MDREFKFKLHPVLRLKELREEELKNQLGQVIGKINIQVEMINNYRTEIRSYFDRYEESENSRGTMTSGLRSYMPEFLLSHYQKIRQCEGSIKKLELTKSDLINRLSDAKAQVKIFSNLKEKKFFEYRKKLNKKIQNEIEELSILKGGRDEK